MFAICCYGMAARLEHQRGRPDASQNGLAALITYLPSYYWPDEA